MRQEVYRVAYDEANAELSEILGKFEQLRLRKDHIEKVVEALKPLIGTNDTKLSDQEQYKPSPERASGAEEAPVGHAMPEAVKTSPSSVPVAVQQSVEQAGDPFSRRLDNAMSISSSSKDVREYSRLFNTGTSRGN